MLMLLNLVNLSYSNIGGWAQGDAATTLAKDTNIVRDGSKSLKITNGDASQAYAQRTFTTASGEDWVLMGYVYGPTTVNGASNIISVNTTTPSTMTATQAGVSAGAWTSLVETCFEATGSSHIVDLGTGSVTNSESAYFDSLQLLPNLVDNAGFE